MKKILFRADAAPHIGIGDLMSLINISRYFDEKYEKYFIIKNYKAGVDLINKYDVKNCFIVDAECSLEEEIDYINDFISKNGINILFLEITERKLSSYIGISKKVKKVCINFDGYILDDLDLVIDWDVEADKFFDVSKYPNTKFLLGPQYVVLPKEFYSKKVVHKKNSSTYKKVLIAMGGADELNFTGKVVDSIIKSNLEVTLNIIVGSGYEYKKILKEKLKNSGMKYTIKQNITNMLDEYLNCDIGIGAGGLTSSELVAAKVSTILIATYEHQIARCKYFNERGWVRYLGYREFSDMDLIDAILNPIQPCENNIFNTHKIVEFINKLNRDIVLKDKEACFYFKYLDWDSEFFNKPSYLLDIDKSTLIASVLVKKEIKNQLHNSFITAKIDTSLDYKIVAFLQECGFVYIDTEITLEYVNNSCHKEKNILNNVQVIKESKNENLPYNTLGESFSLTRFHTDLNIDNVKADALWINYLKNYEISNIKHMFSAEVDGQFAGVILVNIDENIATLFFVAVIEKFRGLGIGTVLITKVLEYFKGYIVKTGTQVKNLNALNFYLSNGLRKIQKTTTILHRW